MFRGSRRKRTHAWLENRIVCCLFVSTESAVYARETVVPGWAAVVDTPNPRHRLRLSCHTKRCSHAPFALILSIRLSAVVISVPWGPQLCNQGLRCGGPVGGGPRVAAGDAGSRCATQPHHLHRRYAVLVRRFFLWASLVSVADVAGRLSNVRGNRGGLGEAPSDTRNLFSCSELVFLRVGPAFTCGAPRWTSVHVPPPPTKGG